MNRKELKEKLEKGALLENLLPLTDGQECMIYKADNFSVTDDIIYIPDTDLNLIVTDAPVNKNQIADILGNTYTGKDFMQECKEHENLTRELFAFVDWQHPVLQDLLDTYSEEEFIEEYGISMDRL